MEFFDNVHGGKTLIDLVTYFDQTYVNGTYRRANARRNSRIVDRLNRSPPLFPPPLWNAFESTVAGSSRTNNACEGWKDQALAATAILQDARGQPATKRQKRSAARLQSRLYNICCDRRDGRKSVQETLRAVSNCIRLD